MIKEAFLIIAARVQNAAQPSLQSASSDSTAHVVANATVVLAVFAGLSFLAALAAAFYARSLVAEARRQRLAEERREQLRFTDLQIRDMTTREMQDAFEVVAANGDGRARAREVFDTIKRTAPDNRSDDVRRYARAASLYDSLLDRFSAYADAGAIDEEIFFGQYAFTLMGLYMILKDYWWETRRGWNYNPRITKFVTRGFMHHMATAAVVTGDDDRLFFEQKARELYPGAKTERLIARYDALRNGIFLEVT